MAKFLGVKFVWMNDRIVKVRMYAEETRRECGLTKPKFQKMSSGAKFISKDKEE